MSNNRSDQPRFKLHDRVFSHYEMAWGTIVRVGKPEPVQHRGEQTDDIDTWHSVEWDAPRGGTSIMNDGGTMGWDLARIVPPAIARRYGYGDDPNPTGAFAIKCRDMTSFEHRGATYYADEAERIYDSAGKVLGYICSRGSEYAWGALDANDSEFARGNGTWTNLAPDEPAQQDTDDDYPNCPIMGSPAGADDDNNDPALDAILAAHAAREVQA